MHNRSIIYTSLLRTAPLALAVLPLSASFGATGVAQGEPPLLLLLCSVLVFAGAAQLIVLGLLLADSPLWLMLLTTLLINSRHLLYATSLLPHLPVQPRHKTLPLAFVLNDETYALSQTTDVQQGLYLHLLSSGVLVWGCWVLGTTLGIMVGQLMPAPSLSALDIILVLTFICLIAPQLHAGQPQHQAHRWTAASAILIILLTQGHITAGLDLLIAGLVGMWVGGRFHFAATEEST